MKIGLLIGRFQPFHFGHLYLIKKSLETVDQLVIGIGSASIYDKNNPLSYEQRRIILKKVIEKENLKEKIIKIIDLEDFFNDDKWLMNVKKKVGKFDLVIGNNEWTNKIMENASYLVKRFPYYKRYLYEGWRIRKLIKHSLNWYKRVPKYLINDLENFFQKRPYVFNHLALGGTFDHFHLGHEKFLENAFQLSEKVLIGITSDDFVKNKFLSLTIESYDLREKQIKDFLVKKKYYQRAKFIQINNFTGGVDKNNNIEVILVTKNTYENGLRLNQLREKNQLKKLRIVLFEEVLADDGKIISSERIRAGEIDRKGRSYQLRVVGYLDKKKEEIFMPESLREKLQKPLGKIFKTTEKVIDYIKSIKPLMVIAVGDVIVDSLLKSGVDPNIKIIDFRSRRQPIVLNKAENLFNHSSIVMKKTKNSFNPSSVISDDLSNSYSVISRDSFNPSSVNLNNSFYSPSVILSEAKDLINNKYINKPGTINLKTAEIIKIFIKNFLINKNKINNNWIVIDGEEDLLTLLTIFFAPLGSLVFYGHWQYGVIGVYVDEKAKNKSKLLLNKFKI